MGPPSPIASVEAFHLGFLRVLERRFDRRRYVVKGGVNIRAWFGSCRYSEDIGLDVLGGEPHQLEATVDRILASRDLELLLALETIRLGKIAKPKMTDTTQRWKLELRTASAGIVRTKIEFSRRESDEPYVLEAVRPDIARGYRIPAPTANHYTAAAAVRQKIRALAMRRTTQARDIWDLEHLFRVIGADPRPMTASLSQLLGIAEDRIFHVSYSDYKSQVVPYLAADHQELFGTPEAWDGIRQLVLERLTELRS